MQGLGFGLLIIGYGVFYAAGKQLGGTGGSVLYWMTGNTALGAPPASSGGGSSAGGDGTTHKGPGGSATPAKGPGGRTTLTTLGGK